MKLEGPVSKTYNLSQMFHAPLEFVFDWCTDYRSDDSKMYGGKTRRRFLERSKRMYVWVVKYKQGRKTVEGVRAVWLMPPDSWHLDTCGDHYETGDYKLTPVGRRTRLNMTFHIIYPDPKKVDSTREWVAGSRREWNAFAKYLDKDYQALVQKQSKRRR